MPDETGVSGVSLQLFDDQGSFCAGINNGESTENVLYDALTRSGVPPPGKLPEPDVTIAEAQLPAILSIVGDVLLATRDATPLSVAVGEYDEATIEVLGEEVSIRLRDPRHYELKRLNSLYGALQRAASDRRSVDVFAVPSLDVMDRALLAAAKNEVPQSKLPAWLRNRFKGLENVTPDSESVKTLRRHAAVAGETDAVEAALVRVASWNLLRRSPDGSLIATRKLQTIRI